MRRAVSAVLLCAALAACQPSEKELAQCAQVSDYAAMVMRGRQTGADMVREMEEATKYGTQAIVREAFAEPGYQTQGAQDRAVLDFKNKMYGRCLDGASFQ